MKKIVLIFGLIAGLIIVGLMFISLSLFEHSDYGMSEVVGYLSMIIALSTIFFGIKSYRDGNLKGTITFGKGFLIGLYISLVASTIYVIGWEIYYNTVFTDFTDQYFDQSVAKLKESGLTGAELDEEIKSLENMRDLYANNIFFRVAITFMEILPVGLLISLISAAILRKKEILPAV